MSVTNITAGRRPLSDIVKEYNEKREAIRNAIEVFEAQQSKLKTAISIGGQSSNICLKFASISAKEAERYLLGSAWEYVYNNYKIKLLATAKDQRRIKKIIESRPEFTVENLYEAFGYIVEDPRETILRGLAEVFSQLDPAFKSHEKMKVGIKGLPKRVIVNNITSYGEYGRERLHDILRSLALVMDQTPIFRHEVAAIIKDGNAIKDGYRYTNTYKPSEDPIETPARDVWLKTYKNGNGHLYFGPKALKAVNLALSEYYGDVLADCSDKPSEKQQSTAVSKDLQYYPTPKPVVERLLSLIAMSGKVLEPSCGCGRILDGLRGEGLDCFGIEYDWDRADQARSKGHNVLTANFLEVEPVKEYDYVVMNPPFYGRHYAKHVRHALKFLKDGGSLYSVLPATARYDHGELDDLKGQWTDLPVGSFSESGTNINTVIFAVRAKRN